VEAENAFAGIGATLGLVAIQCVRHWMGALLPRWRELRTSRPKLTFRRRARPVEPIEGCHDTAFLWGIHDNRRPISIPLSVPISIKSLKCPRCPMRKLCLQVSQSGPEGQVKMFEDRCSQLVSVVTLWSEDCCGLYSSTLEVRRKRFPNPTPKPPRELLLHDVHVGEICSAVLLLESSAGLLAGRK